MIVDAHQHVWDLARAEYPWLGPELAPVNHTVSFAELAPTLARFGIGSTILVQAADNAEDTDLMLETARRHPEVAGVVAWAPLDQPDALAERLALLREDPLVVGIRNLTNGRPVEWITTAEVDRGLSTLEAADLPLDYVAPSSAAIGVLPAVGERHPGLRIVIDHLGRPPIGGSSSDRAEWRRLFAEAAANPNTVAKVSGLYSSVGPMDSWTEEAIRPYVEDALELFGPDRLLYGGDWPISVLAGGYERTWAALSHLFEELLDDVGRAAVLGGTAAGFYRLPSTGG
jgi:L-fuconolactonase